MTTLEIIVITMSFSMVIGAYLGYTFSVLTEQVMVRKKKRGRNDYGKK